MVQASFPATVGAFTLVPAQMYSTIDILSSLFYISSAGLTGTPRIGGMSYRRSAGVAGWRLSPPQPVHGEKIPVVALR